MIIKSAHVSSTDSENFLQRISEAINLFQTEGLNVEVQYHPLVIPGNRTPIVYDALIHGRKH